MKPLIVMLCLFFLGYFIGKIGNFLDIHWLVSAIFAGTLGYLIGPRLL